MGKASRFLKALFGLKSPGSDVDKQAKRRWSFFKSQRDKPQHVSDARLQNTPLHYGSCDQKFRADGSSNGMVEVSAGEGGHWFLWECAAVRIQTYFRAFLARKALRALKSLVRLQALVRGHIQRKQAADLRRYKALVRDQVRARACRFQVSDSPQSATKGPPTPEKFEHVHRSRFTRHNQPSMLKNNGSTLYDERTGKILEMDPTKPHIRRRKLFQPDQISHSQSLSTSRGSTIDPYGLSPYGPGDITSLTSLTGPFKYFTHEEQLSYTAQNSPPFYANSSKNASMRVSPFTPAKSDSSRSCQSGYSDHPNYMAYTESSWAKVRSVSAPRHRPNFELTSITKRYSVYGYGSGTGTGTQRGSNVRDSFVSKAYPGSGRLDRLGMPVGGIAYRESEYSGGYWN